MRAPARVAAVWVLSAAVCGLALGLVDTSPGWDDTGVSACTLLLLSAGFGATSPMPPWLSALAAGLWIPLLNAWTTGSFESAPVLLIALVGAYAGRGARQVVAPAGQ
jgi:hypothetical protein